MAESTTRISLGRIKRLIANYGETAVLGALVTGLEIGMQRVDRNVVEKQISGQLLGFVTTNARRSIRSEVDKIRHGVRGVVGSRLTYVRAHDQGFSGVVQVTGHIRRIPELTFRKGKATKSSIRRRVAALTAGRKSYSNVRPHGRRMNMRARRFLRAGILAEKAAITKDLIKELQKLSGDDGAQ